ncbi:MAG: T9SS type A sorting domain-containing protein [Ignavibacteria bacterium]|nr:T9SS type A sorting domain-containing protein [Ignavibacteria bacterium]
MILRASLLLLLLISASSAQHLWEARGLTGTPVACLAIDSTGTLYAGTKGAGISVSGDQGGAWRHAYGQNAAVACLIVSDRNEVFAGVEGVPALLQSHDAGANWTQVGSFPAAVTALAMDTRGILYAGAQTMFNSEDHGMSWNGWYPFKHPSVIQAVTTNVAWEVFAISTAKRDVISRSTNNSNHWDESFLDKGCRTLAVNAAGNIFAGTDSGMYKSLDNGDTWKQMNAGLGARQIRSIVIGRKNALYAGTDAGVYGSADHGVSWTEVGQGLTGVAVNALVVSPAGVLYAGTEDGIFRIVAPTTAVDGEQATPAQTFALLESFPNPVTASATVTFRLRTASTVSLSIVDALGRVVATLADDALPAGAHERRWTAGDLPGGLYVARLRVGAASETRKMLLR